MEKGLNMEINENCVKQVKAYLEETLEIEAKEKDVRKLVEAYLKDYEILFELIFDDIVFKYLQKLHPFTKAYKAWKIAQKVRTENLLGKIKAIIAYYHEDYDNLADKITDMLSDSSPDLRS